MITPELEFVFAAEGKLAAPLQIGATYEGQRRIIPILDGTFDGPRIKGTFVSIGAADWQYTRGDGVTQADATYAIQTDDGVIIQVQNYGLRHGPEAVMQRLAAGEDVDPAAYYFRTNPRFKAPDGKYDWLNKAIFVASGARYASAIKLWFFMVR
jgi:lipocalin